LKLVNASSDPKPLTLALTGSHPASNSKVVRISAPDTQTTNSIEDPKRIVPVESSLHNASSNFSLTLPPYSIQVIQFDLH
jgi:alpha-N-arabinofuranosidase